MKAVVLEFPAQKSKSVFMKMEKIFSIKKIWKSNTDMKW